MFYILISLYPFIFSFLLITESPAPRLMRLASKKRRRGWMTEWGGPRQKLGKLCDRVCRKIGKNRRAPTPSSKLSDI